MGRYINNIFIKTEEKEFLQNHLHRLKELEGCDVKEVNETDTHYEFVYLKDKVMHSLVIACCGLYNKFSETQYSKFEVSTEPLLWKFEATSCNSIKREFILKKSSAFESLAKIKKFHFHTKEEWGFDSDTLVLEGITKDGEELNYFINIVLYDKPQITTSKYKYLSELGVEATIKEHGITTFSQPTDMLSQWYTCSFSDEDGVVYNSAEQYMMAKKAKLFYDDKIYNKIMNLTDMKTIKELGKKVHYFEQERWDEYKEDIVYEANYLKFSQNRELKEYLLSTNKSMIVEINPNDTVWACGCFERDASTPELWRGKNLLGHIFMKLRESLRDA
jgi:ribA/ribD-fused uncharacterized protein